MMLQLPVCMLVLMWWLSDEGCCLDVPQVRVKTKTCLGGQVRQKAFVETLMLMPQSHPSQWPRGAWSPFQHMLLGRCCEAVERTFRVVNVSTILARVLRWTPAPQQTLMATRTQAWTNFTCRSITRKGLDITGGPETKRT